MLIELLHKEGTSRAGEAEVSSTSSFLFGLQDCHCPNLRGEKLTTAVVTGNVRAKTDTCKAFLRGSVMLNKFYNTIRF